MKSKIQNPNFKMIIVMAGCLFLLILTGCDAFVRKFTRKPKTKEFPETEMILAPEEYQEMALSPAQQYQQYFLFWKTWQDELIVSLQEERSQKKQVDCLQQAIKNLENLRPLLKEGLGEVLERYIEQEKGLLDSIRRDIYGRDISGHMSSAERIRRNVLRDLTYGKIKAHFTDQP